MIPSNAEFNSGVAFQPTNENPKDCHEIQKNQWHRPLSEKGLFRCFLVFASKIVLPNACFLSIAVEWLSICSIFRQQEKLTGAKHSLSNEPNPES